MRTGVGGRGPGERRQKPRANLQFAICTCPLPTACFTPRCIHRGLITYCLLPTAYCLLLLLPARAGLREAAQKVDQGIATFQSGDYKGAAAAFDEAEQAQPGDERITFDRACALAAGGEADKAIDLFQQVTLARDKPLVASSHYNLGCLAMGKAKTLLGAHPEEAAADARKEGAELVTRAVGHFRDCLNVDPQHADARYNLESIRLWLKHIEAVWKDRDRQKRRNEMNLLEFLQMLETEQRAMRSVTPVLAALPPSPKQRQAVREAQSAQRALGEEIEPLKGKIKSALTAPAQAPGNAAAPPSASGTPQQAPDANTQRAIDLLTGLAEEVGLAMERAANRLGDHSFASVTKEQTAAVERLDEIFMAVAPYVNLVQKAIAAEEGLAEQSAADNDSPHPQGEGQGAADNSPRPRGEGQGVRDQTANRRDSSSTASPPKANDRPPQSELDEAAWNQRFVTRYSQILPAKARRELEQLTAGEGQQAEDEEQRAEGGGRRADHSDDGGVGKLKALDPSAEENKKKDEAKEKEEEQPAPPQTEGEQNQQELQKQELKRALKKGIDLSPLVETLSTDAAKLLEDGNLPEAHPKQQEALRLLQEMLPKQQQKQDEQKDKQDEQKKDQKDQQDQQKEQPKDQQKDQQKDKKDQQKDQQQKQPKDQQQQRDLSKQQAEAVLRRIHQRQQERQELEKQLQQYLYRSDKVEKDW